MALADLLNLNSAFGSKVGISEERINEILPVMR